MGEARSLFGKMESLGEYVMGGPAAQYLTAAATAAVGANNATFELPWYCGANRCACCASIVLL